MKKLLYGMMSVLMCLACSLMPLAAEEEEIPQTEDIEEKTEEEILPEFSEDAETKNITIIFDGNAEDVTGEMEPQILTAETAQPLKRIHFSREGYVFLGWNTMPDGSGIPYEDGQKILLTARDASETVLYAQWEEAEPAEYEAMEESAALAETTSDFTFMNVGDGTLWINSYYGKEAEVTVPSSYDGKQITGIGKLAFAGNTSITSVTIPEGIEFIDCQAFMDCWNLSKAIVPGSVKEMGTAVFYDCNLTTAGPIGSGADLEFGWTKKIPDAAFGYIFSMREITVPEGITDIGWLAFTECHDLQKITIPASVKAIGTDSFHNCKKLRTAGPTGSGADYEFGWTERIPNNGFSGAEGLEEVILPEGIVRIGYNAFINCKSLKSLHVPDSVQSLSEDTFINCICLEEINIPKSVEMIGENVFENCSSLKSIHAESVYFIDNNAFKNCTSLAEIWCPKLYILEPLAFAGCTSLTKFTAYNGSGLEPGTFADCVNLREITLGKPLKTVGEGAFANVPAGLKVYFFGSEKDWKSIAIRENNEALKTAEILYMIPAERIALNHRTAELNRNEVLILEAEVFPKEAVYGKLVWESTSPEVASVDENGRITALSGGETVIVVSTEDGLTKEYCDITVLVPVTAIRLNKNELTLEKNETEPLQAEIIPEDATEKTILWSSDTPAVANVDDSGTVTAVSGGTARITASAKDGTAAASCAVTVHSRVESIAFAQKEYRVSVGKTRKTFVQFFPADASDRQIQFVSGDPSIVSVDENGVILGMKEGTTTVKAVSHDGGFTAECTVSSVRDEITVFGLEHPFAFTGSAIKPAILVFDSGTLLQEKIDYTVSCKDNINAGEAVLILTGKGAYGSKKELRFTIARADLREATADAITLVQTKTPKKLTVKPSVTWYGKKLRAGTDYEIDYNGWDQTETGEFDILLKGKGNFDGIKTIRVFAAKPDRDIIPVTKLKVTAKAVQYEDIKGFEDKFPEVLRRSEFTLMDGKTKLARGTDFEIPNDRIAGCDRAGTCTFVIEGNGDRYYGERTVSVKINGTAVSKAKPNKNAVYDGTRKTLENSGIDLYNGNIRLREGIDYEVLNSTYENNINAGKATVMIEGLGAYSGRGKITFTISPNTKNETKSAEVKDVPYSRGGAIPEVTVKDGDKVLAEGADYKLSYKNNKKVGTGSVTVSFQGNYKGAAAITKNFRITQKDMRDVYVTAADPVWKNKAGNYKAKITVIDTDGKKLSAGSDYDKNIVYKDEEGNVLDAKAIVPENARVTAVITGRGNYEGSTEITCTVSRTVFDLSKAAFKIRDREYTGSEIELEEEDITTATIKDGGMIRVLEPGRDYGILCYENNVKKGTAKVTFIGMGSCSGTKTVTFKITQRQIGAHWREAAEKLAGWFRR